MHDRCRRVKPDWLKHCLSWSPVDCSSQQQCPQQSDTGVGQHEERDPYAAFPVSQCCGP